MNCFVSDGEVSELLLHPSNEWLLIAIDNAELFRFDLESQSVTEIQLRGTEGYCTTWPVVFERWPVVGGRRTGNNSDLGYWLLGGMGATTFVR